MSYTLKVLSSSPSLYFMLGETSGTTMTEVSGNAANGTFSSAPTGINIPLVNANITTQTFTANRNGTATLGTDVFNATNYQRPFTIEAWVVPVTLTGDNFIAGRGANNGLYITKSGFKFSVVTSAGTITASYVVPRWAGAFHVVGVYDGSTVSLNVNGNNVASTEVSSAFTTTSTTFQIGGINTGSDVIRIGHVAAYRRALTAEEIISHWNFGVASTDYLGLLSVHGAVYWTLDDLSTDIVQNILEDDQEDFATGTLTNLVWDNDKNALVQADTATSATRTIFYDIGESGTIDGSRIDWDATSTQFTLSTSVDGGSTWQSATNHTTITNLGEAVNTTGKTLGLQMNFATGTAPAELSRVHVVLYSNKNPMPSNDNIRPAVTEPFTLAEVPLPPGRHNEYAAMKMQKSGNFTIPAGSSTYAAFETWVRRDADASTVGEINYIFDTRATGTPYVGFQNTAGVVSLITGTGMTAYVNGTQKTLALTDFPVGRWIHLLIVFTTPFTGPIVVNSQGTNANYSNFSYMFPAVYYTAPAATVAATHYRAGFGTQAYGISDIASPGKYSEISWNAYVKPWQTTGASV